MKLKDNLTVVLTTHVLPTAPSTHIIESCIFSIRKYFENINECDFLIYCDIKETLDPITSQYLQNLNKIKNIKIIPSLQSSLKVNYLKAINEVKTPFMLLVEHDWVFLNNVDTPLLLNTMVKDNSINWVRFNKRDNNKAHSNNPEPGDVDFWENYIEKDNSRNQPLVKTDCIATHPHIVRINNFKDNWSKYLHTWSIESDLHHAYNRDIKDYGFKEAHKQWGVYNYGSINDKKIITHLDGSNSGRT